MAGEWFGRKPNPRFPACAQVARRMLAELSGCKPGDEIPAEASLLKRAADLAADGSRADQLKAVHALAMVREIGGL